MRTGPPAQWLTSFYRDVVALCPQGTYFFGGSGPLTWAPDVKYLAGFLLTPHWAS